MPRATIEAELTQTDEAVNILIKPKETSVESVEEVEEMFKPAQSVETAVYVVSTWCMYHGASYLNHLLHEVLLWVLSIIIRCVLAHYLIMSTEGSEDAHVETCKNACQLVLLCGMFLFVMKRMQEFLDIFYTFLYFRAKLAHRVQEGFRPREELRPHKVPLSSHQPELDGIWSVCYEPVPYPDDVPPVPPRIASAADRRTNCACLFEDFVLCVTLAVKFAVEAYVSVAGALFVVASKSNQEVILNCLAVTFVSEIDEMMFTCFSGEKAKRRVKNQQDMTLNEMFGTFSASCITPSHIILFLKWMILGGGVYVAWLQIHWCEQIHNDAYYPMAVDARVKVLAGP